MHIRNLELKDAQLMHEWMHDEKVTRNLRADFASKTLQDAEDFIINSWTDKSNLHLAIASESDEYMGTVSLKHIEEKKAEFGITMRTSAMGRGYSWFGMESIVRKAFEEMDLESVYWCVDKRNERAVRFYDKHNFHEVLDIPKDALERYKGMDNLKWYSILKGDEIEVRDKVAGCNILHINTIPTVSAGELSFFEGTHEIPFDIKRVYYISKVPEGVRRGFHAHKKLKQLLFCPYGKIQLVLENEEAREEIILSDPSVGVLIEKPTWREMIWLQKDSVLCVAASDYFKDEDYIRDYSEYKKYMENNKQ